MGGDFAETGGRAIVGEVGLVRVLVDDFLDNRPIIFFVHDDGGRRGETASGPSLDVWLAKSTSIGLLGS